MLELWNCIEVYRSKDPFNRPAINSFGLARGLVYTPFTFTKYAIYTFSFTLKS